jgi:D-tyrosyl-tRNA(Tyr) deacylase
MRAVVSRVTSARVDIEGKTVAAIEKGFLVLAGVSRGDTEADAVRIADRICGLRVFEDGGGKMNLSPDQAGASVLLVPNFTLYGDCFSSRRPGFTEAAKGDHAKALFHRLTEACRAGGLPVFTGVFGADMAVFSINDGPVTLILSTD